MRKEFKRMDEVLDRLHSATVNFHIAFTEAMKATVPFDENGEYYFERDSGIDPDDFPEILGGEYCQMYRCSGLDRGMDGNIYIRIDDGKCQFSFDIYEVALESLSNLARFIMDLNL